jgi:ABC-type multidrug transport system ATPase subunit
MQLEIKNLGKQFSRQWLFKHVSFDLSDGQSMSVTGRNGSGKSTLVQIVYGLINASEGEVHINSSNVFEPRQCFSISTPYMELPWEFSISEIHHLYASLHKTEMKLDQFLEFAEFSRDQAQRPVKQLSSGMQQRLKTALCLSSSAAILLLDEPLTNMDRQGELWYRNCISKVKDRICIIAGNNPVEYEWADLNLQLG